MDQNICHSIFQIQGDPNLKYAIMGSFNNWNEEHDLIFDSNLQLYQSNQQLTFQKKQQIKFKAIEKVKNIWQQDPDRQIVIPDANKVIIKVEFNTDKVEIIIDQANEQQAIQSQTSEKQVEKEQDQQQQSQQQQQDTTQKIDQQQQDLQQQQFKKLLEEISKDFENIQLRNNQVIDNIQKAKENLEQIDQELKTLLKEIQDSENSQTTQ